MVAISELNEEYGNQNAVFSYTVLYPLVGWCRRGIISDVGAICHKNRLGIFSYAVNHGKQLTHTNLKLVLIGVRPISVGPTIAIYMDLVHTPLRARN